MLLLIFCKERLIVLLKEHLINHILSEDWFCGRRHTLLWSYKVQWSETLPVPLCCIISPAFPHACMHAFIHAGLAWCYQAPYRGLLPNLKGFSNQTSGETRIQKVFFFFPFPLLPLLDGDAKKRKSSNWNEGILQINICHKVILLQSQRMRSSVNMKIDC